MPASVMVIAGVAMFFNMAAVLYKYQEGNTANATLDLSVLGAIMYLFSGSTAALVIGTIASALFSVYLIFKPVDTSGFEDW